eukprot:scaffold83173_cov76-Phaeocystis_antarctica.AAC.2
MGGHHHAHTGSRATARAREDATRGGGGRSSEGCRVRWPECWAHPRSRSQRTGGGPLNALPLRSTTGDHEEAVTNAIPYLWPRNSSQGRCSVSAGSNRVSRRWPPFSRCWPPSRDAGRFSRSKIAFSSYLSSSSSTTKLARAEVVRRVALQPALLGLVGLVHVAPELLSHQPHRQRPTHFQR